MNPEPVLLYPGFWDCDERLAGGSAGFSTSRLSSTWGGSRLSSFDVTRAIGGKVGGREVEAEAEAAEAEAEADDASCASRGDVESALRGD